ncbi:MAG: hypothetical protein DRG55_05700, partial [Deltaproteobacteria bacterium]
KEMLKDGDKISFFVLPSIRKEMEEGWLKPLRLVEERILLEVRVFFLEEDSLPPPAKGFLKVLLSEGQLPSSKKGRLEQPPLALGSRP